MNLRPRRGVLVAGIGTWLLLVGSGAPPSSVAATTPEPPALPSFDANTDPSFNGLGFVPPMGWDSWAAVQLNISQDLLIGQAEALVSSGLAEAGYHYINLGSGWAAPTRDAEGNLVVDPVKFPGGLQPVVDRVHALGLGFGISTDASKGLGCAGQENASYGHERDDFALFLSLGVDHLKVDGYFVNEIDERPYPELAHEAFGIWSTLILESDAPIHYLQQAPSYALINDPASHFEIVEWSATVSNSWRTGIDIANSYAAVDAQWQTILTNLEQTLLFAEFAGPGHFNDPDFLIIGNGISLGEGRVQFGAWAMMAAPLIVSTDLTSIAAEELDLLTNQQVIAIDQDPLGVQGREVDRQGDVLIMLKPLADDRWAVLAANLGDAPGSFSVSLDWLAEVGVPSPASVTTAFTETPAQETNLIAGELPPRDAEIYIVEALPAG